MVYASRSAAWARWWRQDFSWAGLANKKPGGGIEGGQTLQDYWRCDPSTGAIRTDAELREAGELVDCDGIVFHIAHLPQSSRAGTPTWKHDTTATQWKSFEALVATRIAASERGEDCWPCTKLPDRTIQLDGAVLLGAPKHLSAIKGALDARFDDVIFLRTVDFGKTTFAPGLSFAGATFLGDANFEHATFLGEAVFEKTTFSAAASFESAIFSGDARLSIVTFSGEALFSGATFARSAEFSCATFSSDVWFGGTTFSSYIGFRDASFSGYAGFSHASFFGLAAFRNATFSGVANFKGATFFNLAEFEGGIFAKEVNFADASFRDISDFSARQFVGRASFDRASFHEGYFIKAPSFHSAVFERVASFKDISWPETPHDWYAAFDKTRFCSAAVFTGARSPALAAFDGAVLEGGIALDLRIDSEADRRFKVQLSEARKDDRIAAKPAEPNEDLGFHDCRLAQLERGCRVLKQAMEKASNKTAEQQFHRFELIARREQQNTPLAERVFSHLYGIASNYGASLGRPILALLALWTLFAFVYWLFAHTPGARWADAQANCDAILKPLAIQALSFSASRVMPFGAFEVVSREWITAFGCGHEAWLVLILRFLATIESVLAVSLVFVFGFAMRRKFQIG